MLDKIHLLPHCTLSNNVICGLEHFKAELGQHGSHKVGVGIGEKRHVGDEVAAVEVNNLLHDKER